MIIGFARFPLDIMLYSRYIVPKADGIPGHYTNHSLRVTSATMLYEACVDEQLIMQRKGHSSTAVRAYK